MTGPRSRRFDPVHHLVLGGTAFVVLFPTLWALLTSVRPANRLFELAPPPAPSLEHYAAVLTDFPIGRMLVNTAVMATGVTALQVLVAVLAGYALVRFRPRWADAVLVTMTVALVVPAQALIIPQFLLATSLGWRNTYAGLIVPQLAGSALAVLLLHQHLTAVPRSLLDAAEVDGATPWETLWSVVVPQLRPAIGAVSILVFINTWNEYLWPTLIAPSAEHTTIQTGLQIFANQEGPSSGALLAAAMIATVPVVLVYLLASRRVADAFLQPGSTGR